MALHGRLCLTPKTVKGEPRESLTEGGRGRPISQLRGHSRPVWAGVLREIFGFPPRRRSKRRNTSAHPGVTPATGGDSWPYRGRTGTVPATARFGALQAIWAESANRFAWSHGR
jgi:hypothetical protein